MSSWTRFLRKSVGKLPFLIWLVEDGSYTGFSKIVPSPFEEHFHFRAGGCKKKCVDSQPSREGENSLDGNVF